jgi:hypothetical protein
MLPRAVARAAHLQAIDVQEALIDVGHHHFGWVNEQAPNESAHVHHGHHVGAPIHRYHLHHQEADHQ